MPESSATAIADHRHRSGHNHAQKCLQLVCLGRHGHSFLQHPVLAGNFEISAYGGYQTAPHSNVEVSDQPDFPAGWEGNSFKAPQYYGFRGTYWFDEGRPANWGVSLDYTDAKVYATDSTMAEAGWSHFEFTDGLNLLTVNAIRQFPLEDSKFVPISAPASASTCRMWK